MAGVTSSYPAALDSESNLTPPNNGDTLSVADHWLAGNSGPIVAIETELGTDPAGSFTDVKSRLDSGLVTQADLWRLTADITTDGVITSNLERADSASSGLLGTGMSESSGIFSFPETGIYLVMVQMFMNVSTPPDSISIDTLVTTDNSSYSDEASAKCNVTGGPGNNNSFSQLLVDVTDVANVKVKFEALSIASGNLIFGNTSRNDTTFSFIRLGGT